MMKYQVKDTTGEVLRTFKTYQEAWSFCYVRGRMDWDIVPLIEY